MAIESDRSSSPGDTEKKGADIRYDDAPVMRRASAASKHSIKGAVTVENLDDLPDPDAGCSPEERQRIVCVTNWLANGH